MIYITSDLHFCHDREFIYKPRGFNSVEEMNNAIVEKWNNLVGFSDDVYVLGDLMLCDNEKAMEYIKKLNGKLHIAIGNHDTDNRIALYKSLENVVEINYAYGLKHESYKFYLTHYPCFTGSLEHSSPSHTIINLFGHTHSKELFYEDRPYMYNVAMDAHNCTPVCINDVISDVCKKYEECKKML